MLFAFDFDGTLAPIVRDPEKAFMSEGTASLLAELARHVPVAIVSGRSLADLRSRVGFKPRYLVGNHGLEGIGGGADLRRARGECRKWKRELERNGIPEGVILEDKHYSLSLHYRNSPAPHDAECFLAGSISTLKPAPRVIPGKWVFNLMPTKRHHKGVAVMELRKMAKAKSVLYVGDDHTDEDVFRLKSDKVVSVRIGKAKRSGAKYYIRTQRDIGRLLRALIRLARAGEFSGDSPRAGKARRTGGTPRRTRSAPRRPRPAARSFRRKPGRRSRTARTP